MPDLHPQARPSALTPRQDRIEQSLVRLLAGGAPRSQLRERVYEYADLHRLQGSAPERSLAMLKALVHRGLGSQPRRGPEPGHGADMTEMIVRWYTRRFSEAGAAAAPAYARVSDEEERPTSGPAPARV